MSTSSNSRALIETALFAALAMVLSFIPDFASWITPSFGAIPLIFICLRRGLKHGLVSGFIWGLLHFILGKVYYLNLSQVIIEYLIAFTVMGLAGLFANRFQKQLKTQRKYEALTTVYLASFIACAVRYFFHFVAGFLFWGSYAPKGMGAVWYSLTVNVPAGLATWIIVVVCLTALTLSYPHLFEID
ncbi:energy-coupled thiamine transporter ThiT [Streptococcus sciuri]|uniref:Energy-coupled thiamine transporter ThiT n=1 Tax=Streptococcus sciuri TaxID=2973939 RepID=A0ABT2F4S1_9STRE|nr:energy-coupled thiamine transporter ThiT [Streptococcus sciuri]MCS4487480.1 energy-coupled thiamine transporter ThiT [Streptococcus sciuri]